MLFEVILIFCFNVILINAYSIDSNNNDCVKGNQNSYDLYNINDYINLIKENLASYSINIDEFKNCSSITDNYDNDSQLPIDTINECINIYLKNKNMNYKLVNVNGSTDKAYMNTDFINMDESGNIYCVPQDASISSSNELTKLNLVFNSFYLAFSFDFNPSEFLNFLYSILNFKSDNPKTNLQDLLSMYLTYDSYNNRYLFHNIPIPYYISKITCKDGKIYDYSNGNAQDNKWNLHNSVYDKCLGFKYKWNNNNNNKLIIHNLIALTNDEIDKIFNEYNYDNIKIEFYYTKGYASDYSKVLRILRHINKRYEYRINMCQVENKITGHNYITINNKTCNYKDNYDVNNNQDDKCEDVLEFSEDFETKGIFNPSYVNFQIVGDTPINNYIRRSLQKVKAFAINEFKPENITGRYIPELKQNEMYDYYDLKGEFNISYYGKPLEVDIKDMIKLVKITNIYKDNYVVANDFITNDTIMDDYCHTEIDNKDVRGSEKYKWCNNTYHYCGGVGYYIINNDKLNEFDNGNINVVCNHKIEDDIKICNGDNPVNPDESSNDSDNNSDIPPNPDDSSDNNSNDSSNNDSSDNSSNNDSSNNSDIPPNPNPNPDNDDGSCLLSITLIITLLILI